MLRLLKIAAILVVVLNGSIAAQLNNGQETTEPLMAGVVRKDGVIVPLGLYKNGHCSKIGPETCSDKSNPSSSVEALASFDGKIQIPQVWYLWNEEGAQPVVLKASKPVKVQSHCCEQWGWATGPKTVFKADSFPFPKIGVALSKPIKMELMHHLDPADVEVKSLLAFFSPRFETLEEAALRVKQDNANGSELQEVLNTFYGAHIGSPRQIVPLKLQSVFCSRNAVNGNALFHVEVIKEYPAASCPVVAYGSFWITKDPKGTHTLLKLNGTSVYFFDCDQKGADYFTPLGILASDKSVYVLGQRGGWENENYLVLEVLNDEVRVVLQKVGGRC